MSREEGPIAVDIGSRGVKVAQVLSRGPEIVAVRRGYGPLAADFTWEPDKSTTQTADRPESAGMMQQALTAALRQAGVKGRQAVVILPRQQVTLRFTEFPETSQEEMAKMAALEAEQHIPLPPAETVVGCEPLGPPSPESGLTPVVIAAARRPVVEGYISLLAAANLQPEQISIDSLCLFRLYQAIHAASRADAGRVFLVDLGARGMVINLVEEGLLRMSRAVPGGGEELTRALQSDFRLSAEEAETLKREKGLGILREHAAPAVSAWLENVAAEIRRSGLARGISTRPSQTYLCGGTSLLPGLQYALQEALGQQVGSLLAAPAHLSASEEALFAAALGASKLRRGRGALNLQSSEARAEEKTARQRRTWVAAGVAGGIALLTFIGGSYFTLQQRQSQLGRLAPEWKQARADLSQARFLAEKRSRLAGELGLLASTRSSRHYFLDLLLEVHQRAPKGIWLTSLVVEKIAPVAGEAKTASPGWNVQMTGKAPDNTVVADLVSALSKIPGAKEVNLQSAKAVSFGEKRVVEFSLTCRFAAGEKL